MKYTGYLPEGETIWSRWAVGEYPRIVNADPVFFEWYLERHPELIAHVDERCYQFLMEYFGAYIRKGLSNNWECLFSFSKEQFMKRYITFENELKPHFEKRPGLWFYMFRHDSMKKCKPKKNETCTVDKKCACDVNLKMCRRVMLDWNLIGEDITDD